MSVAAIDIAKGQIAATLAPLLAQHPGETACVWLADNRLAFLARLSLVERAERSVDVQYYFIQADLTGLLLVQRLLAAADRGVRVRILIDDVHTVGQDPLIAAFDRHPRIEVRLFNPFPGRAPWRLARLWQAMGRGKRLFQRMHNKALLIDSAVAVIGGRNLGDEYFGAAAQLTFHDLDLALFGPAVTDVAGSFQCFWDSRAARPIGAIHRHRSATDIDAIRAQLETHRQRAQSSEYVASLRDADLIEKLRDAALDPDWGRAEVVFDDPTKIAPTPRRWLRRSRPRPVRMAPRIVAALESAEHRITLISPYFVPGPRGCAFIERLRARGVRVQVLTNSLAATDVPAVHAGYERYRRRLLRAGVEICEMRPDPLRPVKRGFGGSSGASLHAKAFSVDGRLALVGSMNMDPRSAFLNTELGILVESPALAQRIEAYHAELAEVRNSYRVSLHRTRAGSLLRWDWIDVTGTPRVAWREPDASLWRRAVAQVISWFPLEGQM